MNILNSAKVQKAMRLRAEAEILKAKAKTLIEESNTYLIPVLQAADIKSFEDKDIGKFVLVLAGKRNKFDKPLFKASLILKGVSINVITEAEKLATIMEDTEAYIKYYKPKEGKNNK